MSNTGIHKILLAVLEETKQTRRTNTQQMNKVKSRWEGTHFPLVIKYLDVDRYWPDKFIYHIIPFEIFTDN